MNIKNWHIKEDELYRTAVSNTPKLLPVKIYEMSELIKYVDTAEGLSLIHISEPTRPY